MPIYYFYCCNLEEVSCLWLLAYSQLYDPRPNPKEMLNFLKGPEETQAPSDLTGSGPLSD